MACGPSRATAAAIRPPLLPWPPWCLPARVGRVPRRAAAILPCVRHPGCPADGHKIPVAAGVQMVYLAIDIMACAVVT